MTRTFATLFAAVFATSALANEITLDREIQGASLHAGDVAMSVYYLDHTTHFEVVATYAETMSDPNRIHANLIDGDETRIGLPGILTHSYAFSRSGNTVRVTALSPGERIAKAD